MHLKKLASFLLALSVFAFALIPLEGLQAAGTPVYGLLKADGKLYACDSSGQNPTTEIADAGTVTHLFSDADVTVVPDGLMKGAGALEEVHLPEVLSVGESSFEGCPALTVIDLPKATFIGKSGFSTCTSLTRISLPEVTELKMWAFLACTSLVEIDLPKLKTTDAFVFKDCSALEDVTLPALAHAEAGPFLNCANLKRLDLPKLEFSYSYLATNCFLLASVNLPMLTDLGAGAFMHCSSLTEIDLPKVKDLDASAFLDCPNLKKVNAPETARISGSCFKDCTSLETISLPKAKLYDSDIFVNCTSLTTVDLSSANTIWHRTFQGCTALKTVALPAQPPITYMKAFDGVPDGLTITIPCPTLTESQMEAYRNAIAANCTATFTIEEAHAFSDAWTVDAEPGRGTTGTKSRHCTVAGCPEVTEATAFYGDAEYDLVDAALARVPADLSLYTSESTAPLEAAIAAVERALDGSRQADVDVWAEAIDQAVSHLTLRAADYSKLDAHISKIPTDLSPYTAESVQALLDAKNAITRGLDITRQAEVEEMEARLAAALKGLTLRADSAPATQGHQDLSLLWLIPGALFLTGGCLFSRRRKARAARH